MKIDLSIIISVVSVSFAVIVGMLTIKRNARIDDQKHASELTSVMIELKHISAVVTEIKAELSGVKNDVKEWSERIVLCEASVKSAHKRLDEHLGSPRKE